jgi:glycerophosphoryl diester phosphodiesterase
MPRLQWLTETPIAHRGLHDAARGIVENSTSAVAAALDGGYSIEIDVQLTADGDAVVFHDETVERMTEANGLVAERTCAQLCDITYRGSTDKISSIADLLGQVAGRVPLVIEVKSLWNNVGPLETRLASALADYQGRVAVMSFDPASVKAMRTLMPQTPRGIVACRFADRREWPGHSAWQRFGMRHLLHAGRSRPDFISYDADDLPAPGPWIARRLGLPIITWTVRSEEQRQRALRFSDQITFEDFLP